jgi:hypothetical protein
MEWKTDRQVSDGLKENEPSIIPDSLKNMTFIFVASFGNFVTDIHCRRVMGQNAPLIGFKQYVSEIHLSAALSRFLCSRCKCRRH